MLHIVLSHGGRRENPRGAEVQAGGNALAPPQRRVRLRHLPRSPRLVLLRRELRQRNQIAAFKAVEIVH